MSSLLDKHIFISREEENAVDFIHPLQKKGFKTTALPLIKFKSWGDNEQLFRKLKQFNWIVFTSANGVKYFFHQLDNYEVSKADFEHVNFAVVGTKTEQVLNQYGFQSNFIPSQFDAEHFAEEFLDQIQPEIESVLIVKGNLSRRIIDQAFDRENIYYKNMYVYQTLPNDDAAGPLNQLIERNDIDSWVFTSPSSMDSFYTLLHDWEEEILNQPCFCIGNTTMNKAKEFNFKHILVPDTFTLEGLANKVIEYYSRKESKNE